MRHPSKKTTQARRSPFLAYSGNLSSRIWLITDCYELVTRGNIVAVSGRGKDVAQKVSVTFACDYDSKEIPSGEHMTRAFSLDGRDYEIDLCEKHSQKFDETMRRFADRARRVTSRVGRTKRRTTAHRRRSAEIRAWAKRSGMEVSERGRIPTQVISKYEANH